MYSHPSPSPLPSFKSLGCSPVSSSQLDNPFPLTSLPASFMPEFNREYQKYSRNAYNMATFLVKELQLDWVVFWTGMTYFHRFDEPRKRMNDLEVKAEGVTQADFNLKHMALE